PGSAWAELEPESDPAAPGAVPDVAETETATEIDLTEHEAEPEPAATDPNATVFALEPETGIGAGPAFDDLRDRWEAVQVGFVDEPRRAVEGAAGLVGEAIDALGGDWAAADTSTEDLRVAFQRYRGIFDQLTA
ncbi:MAG TPA: hypothetical protein VGJ43_15990, partial [Acidimicrobiales bacterium]